MRLLHGSGGLFAAAIVVVALLLAAPAAAVIGGTSDTANTYANVGVLQLKVGSDWFDFCSGTLVRPNVVLTGAHCTDFLVDVGPEQGKRIPVPPCNQRGHCSVLRASVRYGHMFTADCGLRI